MKIIMDTWDILVGEGGCPDILNPFLKTRQLINEKIFQIRKASSHGRDLDLCPQLAMILGGRAL